MRRPRQAVLATLGALSALFLVALILDSRFDEPGARPVASLAGELDCRSVLGVFAHPDDEILVSSVLAEAARRSAAVWTVTATRGEGGVPRGFTGTPAELASIREGELGATERDSGFGSRSCGTFPMAA